MSLTERVIQHWYRPTWTPLTLLLFPLSILFGAIVRCRRYAYRKGWLKSVKCPLPIIVVGNITVGGTGKTPIIVWLTEQLRAYGFRPGIIARGVGGRVSHQARAVSAEADPYEVGDEAVLLAQRTGCPVWVATDRATAAAALCASTDCNVILADDGLQHYRLARTVEIVLLDNVRRMGNGWLLPAGPLREPAARLSEVDVVWVKGKQFILQGSMMVSVKAASETRPLADFVGQKVHAIAGIAQPESFFSDLRARGLQVIPHAFPDHYHFQQADICFTDEYPVVMTEKDAVKCRSFAENKHWYVPVNVCPDEVMSCQLERIVCAIQ